MSEELVNHYAADERETMFLLFEQFKIQDLFESEKFSAFSEEDARMIISEALNFAVKEIGPLNGYGDRVGCTYDPETKTVKAPPLHKELQKKFCENGWQLLSVSEEFGGQAAPASLHFPTLEFFCGASTAWIMLQDLSHGAADLIDHFGTPEQRELYCERMFSGQWAGTMCLTEPGAGSEVGASTSRARKNDDGSYTIEGTKCFISCGDHDFTENIIHLALARIEGGPDGTKGLSLFIVPKIRTGEDGTLGESNDVICRGIEHKMGIHASPTATLNFGDNGGCIGYLLGTEENKGISQMFKMMNRARLVVGTQALGTASAAYLSALAYAKERVQGKLFEDVAAGRRDTPSVAIVEHEDVKRMLLEMKSKVEGCRALAFKLAVHFDRAAIAEPGSEEHQRHMGYVDLLTPIVKAYISDQSYRVAELAIQVYGGYGYVSDYPVEQNARDIKIMSLYEGTNYIQALDLVGRKLNADGGKLVRQMAEDIAAFIQENANHASLSGEIAALAEALEQTNVTIAKYAEFAQSGRLRQIPLSATRLLELLAELIVAHLLLEGAVIAHESMQELGESDRDFHFFAGKIHAARFFARNVLPGVGMKAKIIADADTSALDIEVAQFSTAGQD